MLISRVIYNEDENVNLKNDAKEAGLFQLACLRASLSVQNTNNFFLALM
jgi:hypothetical protein